MPRPRLLPSVRRPHPRHGVWLVLLAGCRFYGLDVVDVSGGTAAQRAEVEAGLEDFATWIGDPARVELSSVEIGTPPKGALGAYRVSSRRVELSSTLTGARLREVLHHELCHALDAQEGRPSHDFPGLDAMTYLAAQGPDAPARNDKEIRQEVFARLCEEGPWAASLWSQQTCDQPTLQASGEELLQTVFVAWEPIAGSARGPEITRIGPDVPGDEDCAVSNPLAELSVDDDFLLGYVHTEFSNHLCWLTYIADEQVVEAVEVSETLPSGEEERGWTAGGLTVVETRSAIDPVYHRLATRDGDRWSHVGASCTWPMEGALSWNGELVAPRRDGDELVIEPLVLPE